MVLVAVTGGTSPTLGKAIVTAISGNAKSTAVILSSQFGPTSRYGAEIRTINYASVPSLTAALQDVHTVLSVVKILCPQAVEYETNLLRAAKAAGVKRFAPSACENGLLATARVTILATNKPVVWQACLTSGSDVVRLSGGMSMDHFALGGLGQGGIDAGLGQRADRLGQVRRQG